MVEMQPMTLADKISELKANAGIAHRVALFWERQIQERGEATATAFYKHLGLNHLERKSTVEWEGLTLSREPTEAEKICVKSVHSAQESGKVKVLAVLTEINSGLLDQAQTDILALQPSDYHELVLDIPQSAIPDLTAILDAIYLTGRKQVAEEIAKVLGTAIVDVGEKVPKAISNLAGTIISGLANDAASRVTSIAVQASAVGLEGKPLAERIARDTGTLSNAGLNRAAGGAANVALGQGRGDEFKAEDPEGTYNRSELLDNNTCDPCYAADGEEYESMDDLPNGEGPFDDCDGGLACRGFIVYTAPGG